MSEQRKTVLITGVNTANKGAELMLIATAQMLRSRLTNPRIVVSTGFGTYEERARHGLWSLLPPRPFGRWSISGKLIPFALKERLGLVSESEIYAVLDASGFAFGDQLGAKRIEGFSKELLHWRRQGKRVAMLPQAFGPFREPAVRLAAESMLKSVDIAFARDRLSMTHLRQLAEFHPERVGLCPDFTNLVEAPPAERSLAGRAVIVPNYQMILKSVDKNAEDYIRFIARCHIAATRRHLSPCILLHDTGMDKTLVQRIKAEAAEQVEVIEIEDPLKLKSAIKTCELVIGSRYHALVAALSQGVPVICAGWSHKYEELLFEYDCDDCLIPITTDERAIEAKIDHVCAESIERRARLNIASTQSRLRVSQMWDRVLRIL